MIVRFARTRSVLFNVRTTTRGTARRAALFHVTHVAGCHVVYIVMRVITVKASRNPRIISRRVGGKKPSKSESARRVLAMTRVERGKKEGFDCLCPCLLLHPLLLPSGCLLSPLSFSMRDSTTTFACTTIGNDHQAPSNTFFPANIFVEKLTIDYRSSCVVQRARTLPPSGRKCRLPRGGHLCEVLPAVAAVAAVAAARSSSSSHIHTRILHS